MRIAGGEQENRRAIRPDSSAIRILSDIDYSEPLRRIRFIDGKTEKRLSFLPNNFDLSPLTIARLYKQRWQVELFFKWIKQHLRIKNFYGTSKNAVKTQIWTTVSINVLTAIVKKQMGLEKSLHNSTISERTPF